MKWKKIKLSYMVIILVCIVVSFSILITGFFVNKTITERIINSQEEKAFNVSRMISQTPVVIDGLSGVENTGAIQKFTHNIQKSTNVEFIVVMDMKGLRKSHPDPENIGKKFVGGDEKEALQGKEYSSISEGTLGMSLRTFTPIYEQNGKQIGAVAVGISLERIDLVLGMLRKDMSVGILLGLAFGVIGAVVLSYYVKRILLGLEPQEIAMIFKERQALIESVHEGVIAVDQDGTITMANRSALNLMSTFGNVDNPVGKKVDSYFMSTSVYQALKSGKPSLDQEEEINGIGLVVNTVPIIVDGNIEGAVNTFRDKSKVQQLAEQLTGVRLYADALRSQSHEYMNQLHCILGLIHLQEYKELEKFIQKAVESTQKDISNITGKIKDPALVGFLLGKLSYAREEGIDLKLSIKSFLPNYSDRDLTHDLITILGNLINNSIDAAQTSANKEVSLSLAYEDNRLVIKIQDYGKGIPEGNQVILFEKGFSTKGEDRGYGLFLVKQTVEKLNGSIQLSSELNKGTTFRVSIPYKVVGESDD
ncbi:DcuS/MalK family sensor histidine kinase [Cytobacillus sp. FJAT-54145]|uniref:histidine kinase n=1 Tax=Cytobacillus spartinae TaxID=3299023 RepID=A0ABW6KBK6_9BACI